MENNLNLNSSSSEDQKLEDVIKQSTENIKSEIEEKQKKKRGRPAKNGSEKKTSINNLMVVPNEEMVKIDKTQYEQGIKMTFALMGQYLSKAFKYDGFNLTGEELEALGKSGSECAHYFMPAIHPKWVALGGFTMTFGGIYAMKVVAYNEEMNRQKQKLDDGVKKD